MFKKNLPIIGFFATVILVLITNFSPSKFLIGWDNLMPEFGFWINIKRSLFAVWQEYQGTGLLGGMGHASDLVRQLTLALLSPIMPLNYLRFAWTFLMLFIGPVGAYYLIKNIFLAKESLSKKDKQTISFLGGFFYLLNLSTLQVFYVPFEAFTTHFAFLPWFLFLSLQFLQSPSRKNGLILALILFLGSPSNYVPTLFVVYVLSLAILILSEILISRSKKTLKPFIKLVLIIFSVNAFWLLPFLYFTFTNSAVAYQAKINQMATETVFLQNKAFGNIWDVMLLKGFWFNNIDPDFSGKFGYMMNTWRNHLANLPVVILGYCSFLIILFGLIKTFLRKHIASISFAVLFIFAFTMLAVDSFFFSWINDLFRKIPLFDQAFRFPFTKFSIVLSLCFSIFFAIGSWFLITYLKKLSLFKKINSLLISVLFLIIPIIMVLPIFSGHLFYEKEVLSLPKEYVQLFDYFKNQDKNSRIANFPQASYWGWNYYKWGYGGSGFIWYGIEQPILDRAFDVWSKENENYYWEISKALHSKDSLQFKNVLNKYHIRFILLDENVVSLSSPNALLSTELKQILNELSEVEKDAQFGEISIFKVNSGLKQNKFISLASDLPNIGPAYEWSDLDVGYLQNGNYISSNTEYYYPFRSLFTGKKQENLEFKIYEKEDYFSFQTQIPTAFKGGSLIIPDPYEEEVYEISTENPPTKTLKYPQVLIDGELVNVNPELSDNASLEITDYKTKISLPYINKGLFEVRIPKFSGYNNYNSKSNNDLFNSSFKECNDLTKGEDKQTKVSESILRLENYNSSTCFELNIPSLSSRLGYLINLNNRNLEGKSLLLSVIDSTLQQSYFETNLPKTNNISTSYFIIPPLQEYGLGYNLYFNNTSLGNTRSVNELSNIEVNQIPYRFLTSIRMEKGPIDKNAMDLSNVLTVSHPNQSLYTVEVSEKPSAEGTLILSQAFDQGWRAYKVRNINLLNKIFPFVFGKEIKNHLLINNWENGWQLGKNGNQKIVIVYLPQYLEYIGFLIFLASILFIFRLRKVDENR